MGRSASATEPSPSGILQRFWSKVRKGASDECWPWTGYRSPRAGAKFNLAGRRGGTMQAQRFAWILHYGPAGTLQVLHRCRDRWCMNPRHLFLGTPADRGAEVSRRNQTRFGERHHKARLTAPEVRQIRALIQARPRPSLRTIADRYGITPKHVSDIWKMRIWTRVGGRVIPFDDVRAKRARPRARREWTPVPGSRREAISALRGGIFNATEVARLFGVSRSTVDRIWNGTAPTRTSR